MVEIGFSFSHLDVEAGATSVVVVGGGEGAKVEDERAHRFVGRVGAMLGEKNLDGQCRCFTATSTERYL
jgi:hypothetical protein